MIKRTTMRVLITMVTSVVISNILYLISDKINILEKFSVALNDIDFTDLYYQYDRKVSLDSNICIINIGLLPREDLGRLIEKVSNFNPKVIGGDIFFDVNNDTLNPLGTDTLKSKIKNVKNLVLASAYRGIDRNGNDSIETQSPLIREFVKEGIVSFNVPKEDPLYGTVRSFSPIIHINGKKHLSFSFLLASYYDSTLLKYANEEDMYIKWFGYANGDGNIYNEISYKGVFLTYNWSDVFEEKIGHNEIKDKIVLLGYLGETLNGPRIANELFYSPLNSKIIGRSLPDLYHTELHANAIKMIIDREFVKHSALFDLMYNLLILIFFILALNWIKNKSDKFYPITSKILLIIVVNIFVIGVVAIYHISNAEVKILIGEGIVTMLIIPDTFDILESNVFNRLKI
jgi:CHASE2 domain-containing sensor protein